MDPDQLVQEKKTNLDLHYFQNLIWDQQDNGQDILKSENKMDFLRI